MLLVYAISIVMDEYGYTVEDLVKRLKIRRATILTYARRIGVRGEDRGSYKRYSKREFNRIVRYVSERRISAESERWTGAKRYGTKPNPLREPPIPIRICIAAIMQEIGKPKGVMLAIADELGFEGQGRGLERRYTPAEANAIVDVFERRRDDAIEEANERWRRERAHKKEEQHA